MQSNVPKVKLSEVLTLSKVPVAIDPLGAYKQVTVRLFHKGLVLREERGGQEIQSNQWLVKKDQFVISRIDARNGAMGIIPPDLDGAIVTNDFLRYDIDTNRLDAKFFDFMSSTENFVHQCARASEGTTNRKRLRPDLFLEIEIALPTLVKQQRIVVTLERLRTKIDDVRWQKAKTMEQAQRIKLNLLRKLFAPFKKDTVMLEDACEAIIDNLHSTPKYDGNEFPCVRSQDVNDGSINFSTALRTSKDEFLERIRRAEPQKGDIVYVREGDVGRCAVVDGSQQFSLGQRVMMFRPDQKKIDPKFFFYQLISPPFHEDQVLSSMTGTTSRHVNIKDLKKMKINVPSLTEQRHIVAYLDLLQAKIDEVMHLQVKTEREIETLIPAVLHKAFN